MSGNAIDSLSVWAVRYALGRMTYAVSDVVKALIANKDALTSQSRKVICADIDQAFARGNVGMQMDADEWRRLRADLAEHGSAPSPVREPEGLDVGDVPTLTVMLHNDPALCRKRSPNGHPRWMTRPLCRSVAERLVAAYAATPERPADEVDG